MKKLFIKMTAVIMVAALMVVGVPAAAASEAPNLGDKIIRVGMYYGSDAMDGANLANEVGSGYDFGYYNTENSFVPLGGTAEENISVVKTENVYYGSYNNYTSYHDQLTSAPVAVGCYHLQTSGTYASFDEAQGAASAYGNGFVAYIGGVYYVRIGNYTTRAAAEQARAEYSAQNVATEIKGTSSYGVSVVKTGTNQILFQYDDNGTGTGLGVQPKADESGSKCVTWFKGCKWYGGFRYHRIGGGDLTVVNMVALDDYVKGVVPREMISSWHVEALKAQAVCARNYAIYNLNKHNKKYSFDICTTTECQVYGGLNRASANSDRAVDETAGVLAYYDGKVINCTYYDSNGGTSESSEVVWGSKVPYLVGVVDPYEASIGSSIPSYSWTRSYTGKELGEKLRAKGYNCSDIVSVKLTSSTAMGNPNSMTFTDSNSRSYTLNARALVTTFNLRSYCYGLSVTGNGTTSQVFYATDGVELGSLPGLSVIDGSGNVGVIGEDPYIISDQGTVAANSLKGESGVTVFNFAGKGWGHNVGMSQYGALAMAKQGKTYDEILKFYYTGITVG